MGMVSGNLEQEGRAYMSAEYEPLTPSEAALAGGSLAASAYGVAVVGASLIADVELFPSSSPLVGVLLVGLFAGGAVLGAGWQRTRR